MVPSDGVAVDLEGKELPQAPELTGAVGQRRQGALAFVASRLMAGLFRVEPGDVAVAQRLLHQPQAGGPRLIRIARAGGAEKQCRITSSPLGSVYFS